jgi:hypothetical protein
MAASADTMRMPDGQMLVGGRYEQVTFANDPASPLNNNKARCTSMMVVGKDGKTVSYSGACFSMDAAGNGQSFWWRQTDAATATCPAICGQFTFYKRVWQVCEHHRRRHLEGRGELRRRHGNGHVGRQLRNEIVADEQDLVIEGPCAGPSFFQRDHASQPGNHLASSALS